MPPATEPLMWRTSPRMCSGRGARSVRCRHMPASSTALLRSDMPLSERSEIVARNGAAPAEWTSIVRPTGYRVCRRFSWLFILLQLGREGLGAADELGDLLRDDGLALPVHAQ